jgi:hypothetical protein
MKAKFENLGFTSIVTKEKLKIEVSIDGLICAFENAENNHLEMKVKQGKQLEFAAFCARNIINECNQHNGDTYLHEAFDKMFDLIFEGYEDASDCVDDPEDTEE